MIENPLFEQTIVTERLRLEPLGVQHAAHLFENLQDVAIHRFIPTDPPVDLDKLERLYAMRAVRVSPDRDEVWLNWAARLERDGSWIGLFEATLTTAEQALVAYTVFPIYWSNGYAREGLTAVLYNCLAPAGVKEVIANIDMRNSASIKLVENLGFSRVSEQLDADFFKGETSHEYTYRLEL